MMLAVLQLVVLSFTASARIRSYAMATSQRALAQMTGAVDFESLSRRELQALAKKAGIRANQKSVEIIAQLHLASDHQSSPAADADAAEEAAFEPIVALAARGCGIDQQRVGLLGIAQDLAGPLRWARGHVPSVVCGGGAW